MKNEELFPNVNKKKVVNSIDNDMRIFSLSQSVDR